MPVFEITQAGINSINEFDVNGNLPTGNFAYCNVYNVDPTTFNKSDFKSLSTRAAQDAYLSSMTAGARDGYATPPNFPYQGNSVPLIRVGNTGSTVANQVAQNVNKISVDQTNYRYLLDSGYGNFYFNLVVVYNTFGVDPLDKPSQDDMPIAFIYLFDGIQSKIQQSQIELNAVFQYAGIAATIEFPINPVVSADLLEVASPDLLPAPSAADTNTYLIRNPSPATVDTKNTATIANLINYDIAGGGSNVLLWDFNGYSSYVDVEVVSNVLNTVFRTEITDYSFNSANFESAIYQGYIFQVITGAFVGQCRRISDIQTTYIAWGTAFGNVLTAGTKLRVYIPDRIRLQNPPIPTATQAAYHYAARASYPNVTGIEYFYDGMGSDVIANYPNVSLDTFTNVVNARYLVGNVNTNLPVGFGSIGIVDVTNASSGRYSFNLTDLTNNKKYSRTVYVGNFDTGWFEAGDSFQVINNVSDLPTGENPYATKYITNSSPQVITTGTRDSDDNNIIITRKHKDFMWSFSTHSYTVAVGDVISVDNSGPTSSLIEIDVNTGTPIAEWNLNTAIEGNTACRFIIQFRKVGDANWTGVARGLAVSNINTGTSVLTVFPKVPAYAVGVEYIVHECNIARIRFNNYYDFQDIDSNNYAYTLPCGLMVKGGLVNVNDSGSSFTFAGLGHTPFPNKCYGVQLTYASENNNAIACTSKDQNGFSADHNNASPKDVFWEAKGR